MLERRADRVPKADQCETLPDSVLVTMTKDKPL